MQLGILHGGDDKGPVGREGHGCVRPGPFEEGRLLLGDPGEPQGGPAIGRGCDPAAPRLEGHAGDGALVLEITPEAGVLRIQNGQGLAGGESDQATFGRGVDRVDPLTPGAGGQNTGVGATVPDQTAIVAAGHYAGPRRVRHRAQDRPVVGGAERAVLEPDRTVAEGEDRAFGVEDDGGYLGVVHGFHAAQASNPAFSAASSSSRPMKTARDQRRSLAPHSR